jgi:hypothetical protein
MRTEVDVPWPQGPWFKRCRWGQKVLISTKAWDIAAGAGCWPFCENLRLTSIVNKECF